MAETDDRNWVEMKKTIRGAESYIVEEYHVSMVSKDETIEYLFNKAKIAMKEMKT